MTYCPISVFPGSRKVNVDKTGIALFNAQWPCSTLRASRSYWFEFEANGDLVDTDCPEHDDGPAAKALDMPDALPIARLKRSAKSLTATCDLSRGAR